MQLLLLCRGSEGGCCPPTAVVASGRVYGETKRGRPVEKRNRPKRAFGTPRIARARSRMFTTCLLSKRCTNKTRSLKSVHPQRSCYLWRGGKLSWGGGAGARTDSILVHIEFVARVWILQALGNRELVCIIRPMGRVDARSPGTRVVGIDSVAQEAFFELKNESSKSVPSTSVCH